MSAWMRPLAPTVTRAPAMRILPRTSPSMYKSEFPEISPAILRWEAIADSATASAARAGSVTDDGAPGAGSATGSAGDGMAPCEGIGGAGRAPAAWEDGRFCADLFHMKTS